MAISNGVTEQSCSTCQVWLPEGGHLVNTIPIISQIHRSSVSLTYRIWDHLRAVYSWIWFESYMHRIACMLNIEYYNKIAKHENTLHSAIRPNMTWQNKSYKNNHHIKYNHTIDISNWTTDHPLKSSRGDALFAQPRFLVHWMRTPGSAKHHKDWGVGENVLSPLWVAIRPIRFCSCLGSGVISELKTQISCSHSWCWIYHDIYIYIWIYHDISTYPRVHPKQHLDGRPRKNTSRWPHPPSFSRQAMAGAVDPC